jgi:hypothetical protein
VVRRLATLADDTKGVVLHDGSPADSAQEALLHAPVESQDGNLG